MLILILSLVGDNSNEIVIKIGFISIRLFLGHLKQKARVLKKHSVGFVLLHCFDNLGFSGRKSPSDGGGDYSKASGSRNPDKKLGHRRVGASGETTYKKVRIIYNLNVIIIFFIDWVTANHVFNPAWNSARCRRPGFQTWTRSLDAGLHDRRDYNISVCGVQPDACSSISRLHVQNLRSNCFSLFPRSFSRQTPRFFGN